MRSVQSLVILLLLVGCAGPRTQQALPVSEVEAGETVLMGRLGRPLGTVCMIEAVVVEVSPKMHSFGNMGRHYGLRIDRVDGRALDRPVVSRFVIHLGAPLVKVAPNDLALDQLISRMSRPGQYWTVTEDGFLTDFQPVSQDEAAAVRARYVGSKHTLLVYETAEYWGAPKDVPEGYGFAHSDPHEFHLAAHVVVCAESQPRAAEPSTTDNPDDAQRPRGDH